jgi:three-Cys-motif partner protein
MCKYCSPELHGDGQSLLNLGQWAENKLYYLDYYASLFTSGMKQWKETAYIDLFAGPGLCSLRTDTSRPKVVDGSPMVALSQKYPFTHYVFVDSDTSHVSALKLRSRAVAPNSHKRILCGDCNDAAVLTEIVQFIPSQALCLAFIDPFNWNIDFDTVRTLATSRRLDIILVFQLGGIKRAVEYNPASLSQFFGDGGKWHDICTSTPPAGRTRALLDYYKQRLSTLGYLGQNYPSEVPVVNTKNVPLYYMVFATKHPRGQDFWQKSIQRTASGARKLPGF